MYDFSRYPKTFQQEHKKTFTIRTDELNIVVILNIFLILRVNDIFSVINIFFIFFLVGLQSSFNPDILIQLKT